MGEQTRTSETFSSTSRRRRKKGSSTGPLILVNSTSKLQLDLFEKFIIEAIKSNNNLSLPCPTHRRQTTTPTQVDTLLILPSLQHLPPPQPPPPIILE